MEVLWQPPIIVRSDARLDVNYYLLDNHIENYFADLPYVLLEDFSDEVTDGTRSALEFSEQGIPFLRIADLTPPTINKSNVTYVTSYQGVEKKAVIREGDILIPKVGTHYKPVIVDAEGDGAIIGPDIIKIRLRSKDDVPVVSIFFNSDIGQMQLEQSKSGSILPKVSIKELRKIRLPAPGTIEWQRAEDEYRKESAGKNEIKDLYLQWNSYYDVDELRYEKEKLPEAFFVPQGKINPERLDFAYYQVRQNKAFHDFQDRIQNENWVALKDIIKLNNSPVNSKDLKGSVVRYIGLTSIKPETFSVFHGEDIEFDRIKSRARYRARDGDIIIGIVGPTIGQRDQALAIITSQWEGALVSSAFAVLRSRRFNPYYLLWCLHHPFVRFQMQWAIRGQWQQMLSLNDLRDIMVPVYPEHQEKKIAGIMQDYVRLKEFREGIT